MSECQKISLMATELTALTQKALGLWENEYYQKRNVQESFSLMEEKFNLAESGRKFEQDNGLDLAVQLGRSEKKKKAWKKLATWGIPIGVGVGLIVQPVLVEVVRGL